MRGPSIRVCAENLGLKDHKEISQSLRELISSKGIKKNEIADLSLEKIEQLAYEYLESANRRYWGPPSQPLVYPEDKDKIKPHVIEILLRQKENQIDIRNRTTQSYENDVDMYSLRGESEDYGEPSSTARRHSARPADMSKGNSRNADKSSELPLLTEYIRKPMPLAAQPDSESLRKSPVPINSSLARPPATEKPNPMSEGIRKAREFEERINRIERKRTFDTMSKAGNESFKKKPPPLKMPNPTISSRTEDVVDLTSQPQSAQSPQNSAMVEQRDLKNESTTPRPQVQPETSNTPSREDASAICILEFSEHTYALEAKALPDIVQGLIDRLELSKLEQRTKIRKLSGEEAIRVQSSLTQIKSILADLVQDILAKQGRLNQDT